MMRPVVVLSGDWVPFSGLDLPGGGPLVEIMSEVLAAAGFEPHVSFTTWEAAEVRVVAGAAFGAFPLVRSENREQRLSFSSALMTFDYVLFVRAGDPNAPTTATDLASLRVGGIEGYDYWHELEEAAGELVRYPSTAAALLALAAGEIDVLAEGEISGLATLGSPELPVDAHDIAVVASTASWARSTESLHFVMQSTQDARAALERIDSAIAEVKKSPDYARWIARLVSEDADRITLVNATGGLVDVHDEAGAVIGESPTGVRGVVLRWPAPGVAENRVKVKLANGPLAGRIVWVDLRFVEVSP